MFGEFDLTMTKLQSHTCKVKQFGAKEMPTNIFSRFLKGQQKVINERELGMEIFHLNGKLKFYYNIHFICSHTIQKYNTSKHSKISWKYIASFPSSFQH